MIKRSKLYLRQKMKLKREIASKQNGPEASFKLRDLFLRSFHFEKTVVFAAYWPIQHELNILPLVNALREKEHIISLPRIQSLHGALDFGAWDEKVTLIKSSFGTMTVPPEATSVIPNICLVPLLGFDRLGYRLGYGQGHYDRTLEKLRKIADIQAIGIGFSDQEVTQTFHEPHDELLDFMITENEVIRFRNK